MECHKSKSAPDHRTGRCSLLPTMTVVVQFQDVADRGNGFGAEFFHQADRPFDDMTQLPGALVRSLQNGGSTLQMITCKHVCGRHAQSP